jgi:hypothetical protein
MRSSPEVLRIVPVPRNPDASLEDLLRERIRILVGGEPCRIIGQATRTHPESVRRYLSGAKIPAEFVRALVDAYGVSADWLLRGEGCMYRRDCAEAALRAASTADLIAALEQRLTSVEQSARRRKDFAAAQAVNAFAGESSLRLFRLAAGGASRRRRAAPAGAPVSSHAV